MSFLSSSKVRFGLLLVALSLLAAACAASASNQMFFGKTAPPAGQVMRYVTGSEPESLDPQLGTGQPEGRIYMALYESFCEFDPKTMEPIPAIAERWDVNKDSSEFTFHLRKNARWSNGEQITARDFLYTFHRGLSPELASRNAYLGYYIKYAQPYNEGGVFVRDPGNNSYLLEKDFAKDEAKTAAPAAETAEPLTPATEYTPTAEEQTPDPDTPHHQFMHAPNRLVLPADEAERAEAVKDNPKLKAALAGKTFEPVKADDMGVEALDDFTFRITLTQSAPFFLGLMAHQFFHVVPQKVIEKYHEAWTRPENIVTCGPFKLKSWKPYNELIVVRDPNYWDAARVQLDEIRFYPMEDNPTIMNLYKAGEVDGVLNHTVPAAWLDVIRPLKDYMDAPEMAITYFQINITRPPMDNVLVRKAFNMAVDKEALSKWRKVTKPLTAFSPEGVFPGYPQPKGDKFDPVKARQLMVQAGYKDANGNYDPKKFPIDQVEITYNIQESNKAISEFLQAQWKQNLGLTLPLKSMEFKTFLQSRANLEYKGIARAGWIGDYLDPVTFLNLFTTPKGDNGTGWYDPKFVEMLNDANRTPDKQKRYELLAKAEAYMLDAQPVIPLTTDATSWMKKPYVKGMYPNPGTMHAWKFVCIEHDPNKWDYGVPDMTSKELPICTK
ncbi:MAG: oligopeptide transport system substrate-binding protein [Blastocatellia bacterium]|jgi:ABC-type oligopeptide transport system substrate-binding subunit|nr:oligopeptide transport system substrate-binding protein [Blastocatellia bacterium]